MIVITLDYDLNQYKYDDFIVYFNQLFIFFRIEYCFFLFFIEFINESSKINL